MTRRRLLLGILALFISVLQLFLPSSLVSAKAMTLFWMLNWLGLILICEYTTRRLSGTSLLGVVRRNAHNTLGFLGVAIAGGLIVEGVGQWLGKLWFYPYFASWEYAIVAVPGFALYMLMISECYLASKAIVDKIIKPRRIGRKVSPLERKLYRLFLPAGIVLIATAGFAAYRTYQQRGGYEFNAVEAFPFGLPIAVILLIPLGIWLLSEYVEYKRREISLLHDILRNYWNPIIAIILATAVVGVMMEVLNLRHGYWVYVNWPWQDVRVLGMPIVMIAIAWPLHFVMFLSLFRAVTAKDSKDVWRSPGKS